MKNTRRHDGPVWVIGGGEPISEPIILREGVLVGSPNHWHTEKEDSPR